MDGLFYSIKNATIKNLGMKNIIFGNILSNQAPVCSEMHENSVIENVYTEGRAYSGNISGIVNNMYDNSIIRNSYSSMIFQEHPSYAYNRSGAGITNSYYNYGSNNRIQNCYFNGGSPEDNERTMRRNN